MLNLTVLILLVLNLPFLIKKALSKGLSEKEILNGRLAKEYENLTFENNSLKTANLRLEKSVEETIALFNITKEICKSLEEENIFSFFKEHIKDYVEAGDCRFIKEEAELEQYKNYTVMPLLINQNSLGYLIVDGIKETDKDKFFILAQQFLVGLKRALLYKKVQELTITDGLTKVFSRRYFLDRFSEELERSKKFKHSLSFLMIDLDHFKEFNDNYGHLVGDAILREVTRTIKESIRQIDFMGRYGGEEISVVLTETDKDQARFAAERIRQAVESRRVTAYDEQLQVTVSIGISMFPGDAHEPPELIDKADEALYLAKQSGRNKICTYGTEG